LKKIFTRILLSLAVIVSTGSVAPILGQNIDNNTVLDSTELHLYAGISKELYEMNEEGNTGNEEHNQGVQWLVGRINANILNVRKYTSIESDVIGKLYFNEKVSYKQYDDEWSIIQINNGIGYIKTNFISDDFADFKIYNAPYTSGKKTYMPYKVGNSSIFSKNSNQYKLQQLCYTGTYGIRMYNNRYCVALGSAFDLEVGQYFDLVLENNTIIPCIMADQKASKHTDASNIITVASGCMSEFIVDIDVLVADARIMGDVSYCCDEWQSRVVQVVTYKKNILKEGEE
jgi:hypothetical protein